MPDLSVGVKTVVEWCQVVSESSAERVHLEPRLVLP
jgi:hypothetical protein